MMKIGKNIFKVLLILTSLFIMSAQAKDWQEDLLKLLSSIEADHSSFLKKLETATEYYQTEITKREKECLGEFSSFVQDEEDKKILRKVELTEGEKRLCQLTLIEFQTKYMTKAYALQEEYIRKKHQQELKILKGIKKKTIDDLKTKSRLLK